MIWIVGTRADVWRVDRLLRYGDDLICLAAILDMTLRLRGAFFLFFRTRE